MQILDNCSFNIKKKHCDPVFSFLINDILYTGNNQMFQMNQQSMLNEIPALPYDLGKSFVDGDYDTLSVLLDKSIDNFTVQYRHLIPAPSRPDVYMCLIVKSPMDIM